MNYLKVMTIITIISTISCDNDKQFDQSSKVHNQSNSVTIEILPTNDVIYKIPDDLEFENWNYGMLIRGLNSVREIHRLQIKHYSGQDQIYSVEYSGNTLSEFLTKKEEEEFKFQNFHMMLPESSAADRLTLEIFSHGRLRIQKLVLSP